MTATRRTGFTLVELLVVIVIISMLIALLLPAVNSARERARRAQCSNNQHELATAIHQYETAKGKLPGYTNSLGAVADNLSWLLVLLPYMGRNDVWEIVRSGNVDGNLAQFPRRMPELICPSDQPEEDFALSYVGNCGKYTPANALPPLYGLLTQQNRSVAPRSREAITTNGIRDGASNTLLFAENIQASQWLPLESPTLGRRRNPDDKGPYVYVIDVGFVWSEPLVACTSAPGDACDKKDQGSARINQCRDRNISFPWTALETDPDATEYRHYARPSSNHPGGVMVTYADGHQDFLNEQIEDSVYLDLVDMAGNGLAAGGRPGPMP